MNIRVRAFHWFKSAQEFLSSLVIGGQPLGFISEKSPFVRAGCSSKSHTVPIYYTKDKMTW